MGRIPLIDLTAQYALIQEEVEARVLSVMRSGSYILGREVRALEDGLAAFTDCRHAVTCANGTDALVIALRAVGVRPGDEVITTPYSFFATSEAIAQVGAVPVFADILPDTYDIDPAAVERLITPKTRALLPVHLFGLCADMDPLLDIARRHGLKVVEDACQAIGATYRGRKAGSMGDAACFSFFPTKNMGAFGDAGAITTSDDGIAAVCRALRVHGGAQAGRDAWRLLNGETVDEGSRTAADETIYNREKYYNYLIAYNSRTDEMQAAILNVKLAHLERWNAQRQELAAAYGQALADTPLVLPGAPDGFGHAWHLYIVQADERERLTAHLEADGIATGTYYPVPLHLQKAHEALGGRPGDCPVAERMSGRTFAIPVYPELIPVQQQRIVDSIRAFFA